MHHKSLALRPSIGLIVMVNPRENVNRRVRRVKHDGTICLVDADRIQVFTLCAQNWLVIHSRRVGLLPEPLDEFPNLLLLTLLDICVCQQEIIGYRDGHSLTSFGRILSSGSGSAIR